MNDYIVKLRVAQNVWQSYQVLAVTREEAHAAAADIYRRQFGLPLYDASAMVITLGPYHKDRMNPVPIPPVALR